MSVTGSHYHVIMADASTSTAEDREESISRGLSESPIHNNDSAFTFPKPIYGSATYNQGNDSIHRYEEIKSVKSDPYNDLRDEVSIITII